MKNILFSIIVALSAMLNPVSASAAIIEHQGDRIIVNVEEMDLKGDESLMDILMTIPDVVTYDGRSLIDSNKDILSKWYMRVDNLDLNLDPETFLRNTKARNIRCVKLCFNPGVMKGSGAMKKTIDVYYRKVEDGTSGSVNLEGGTYGNGTSFNTVEYQKKNLNIKGWLIGDLDYRKAYGTGLSTKGSSQSAKVQAVWDATPVDNLELTVTQIAQRTHETGAEPLHSQTYALEFAYTRAFPNGGYGLFQTGCFYYRNKSYSSLDKEVDPYGLVEFSFPFLSKDLWLTPGIETGYTGYRDYAGRCTDRQHYSDYYLQADWQLKDFHFTVGDRYRVITYWNHNDDYNTTWSNHFYNVSAWYNFGAHHTLQAGFNHRFFEPGNSAFYTTDDAGNMTTYSVGAYHPECYVSELRYTYQQKKLTLMGLLQNTHQEFERGALAGTGNDNNLALGVSANWNACDWLRFTIGASYNHERYHNNQTQAIVTNNYANLRFLPEVTTHGWRFLATLVYNTRRSDSETFAYYIKPNFYAAMRVSKDITPKWNVYVDAHDLADQRTGNREALIGTTYRW